MPEAKRVFILGAGFSAGAGMPLTNQLLRLILEKLDDPELRGWLVDLEERLMWLSAAGHSQAALNVNIEQVFSFASFDREAFRLKQQLTTVGRGDGPGTPWTHSETISSWLFALEDTLRDVIFETDSHADLAPIERFARCLGPTDAVITFNYDTLAERAITATSGRWNHGFPCESAGISVLKCHGSIDWIVDERRATLRTCQLLFDKANENRGLEETGNVEDDFRLWRCMGRQQLEKWIEGRDVGNTRSTVGMAGLGAYKQLHQVPGLGHVWRESMRALYQADQAIVVGFSLSEFDVMAKLQFCDVVMRRVREGRPLPVTVIDPYLSEEAKARFSRVFRFVQFVATRHEEFDWNAAGVIGVGDKE